MTLRPFFTRALIRSARVTVIATAGMLLSACSGGGGNSGGEENVDPANTLPGEAPVIVVPVVELEPEEFTPPASATMNLYETLESTGNFTRLLALYEKAGIIASLQGSETMTLFAPTDEAFTELDVAIGQGVLDTFTVAEVDDRLRYHSILDIALDSTALREYAGQALSMGNGLPAAFSINDSGELLINSSIVTTANIATTNGILHIVDTVLTPPVRITDPNDNIPPPTTTDIASLLLEQSDYSTLLTLIEQAGVTELLQQDNGGLGWTLFAPSDAAFERWEQDAFELSMEDATQLVRLHLYNGQLTTADMVAGELVMSGGSSVDIVLDAETGLSVGGAKIVGRDRVVGNGVIHYVDMPLVPAGS
jgi:uncharacterized surface protein with fasciclin (FAS1) repeats